MTVGSLASGSLAPSIVIKFPHGTQFTTGLRNGQNSARKPAFQLHFLSSLRLMRSLPRPPEGRKAVRFLLKDAKPAEVPLTVLSFHTNRTLVLIRARVTTRHVTLLQQARITTRAITLVARTLLYAILT